MSDNRHTQRTLHVTPATRRLVRLFLWLPIALLPPLLSCNRGYGEGPILGIVYGAITTASGQPVAGAAVKLVELDRATCSQPGSIALDSATTLSSGVFRLQSWSFGGGQHPFSYATYGRISVQVPAGLSLRDTSVNVEYRMYFGDLDSTRVDIRLHE